LTASTLSRQADAPCRRRDRCSLCRGGDLVAAVSLTPTPPGNGFVSRRSLDAPQPCYPLDLALCNGCGHVQLLDIVNRIEAVARPADAVAASPPALARLQAAAEALIDRLARRGEPLVIDLGSNDGSFLQVFKDRGWRVQGVEPAANVAGQAILAGIPTHPGLFMPSIALRIAEERGPALLVTAEQCFAEAEDPFEMMAGVHLLLAPDGLFVFEVAYLGAIIEHGLFDRITHADLDYHSVAPLRDFFAACDMELIRVERTDSHHGGLRGLVQRLGGPYAADASVEALIAEEARLGLGQLSTLARFAERIAATRSRLRADVRRWRAAGKRIAGYGAGPHATTLLYHLGLDSGVIDFIADDSERKHGLYTPGLHIPVLPAEALDAERPDIVLMLAWGHADAIRQRHAAFIAAGGTFVQPLPLPSLA
jgi:hypothetical protein